MASTQINFELVSPEEKLISEPVEHAVLPGTEGEMGVGAGHASFVVALKPGVVQIFSGKEGDDEPRRIFIAGGFADVTGESCTVLAEEAVNVNEIDQAELERQIADLNDDLGMAVEAVDKARIVKRIALAKSKLEAVTGEIQF